MKHSTRYFGLILSLCVPLLAMGQQLVQRNFEHVNQLTSNVEQAIKGKEKSWKLKDKQLLGPVTTQHWRSGEQQLELRIFEYESEDEAARMLISHGTRSVSLSQELKGFGGDQARYIDYPYFTWVGLRRGKVLVTVEGPGKDLALTKRFARHALQEIEKN